VVPDRDGAAWLVRDRSGRGLPLAVGEEAAWKLAAVSGGRPVHLLGEWGDDGVAPLGVWSEDRMVVL
jgi:hypothetical protein